MNRHELIMLPTFNRRPRSLLPVIGSTHRALFGLMDEAHAEDISQILKENLKMNQQKKDIVQHISAVQFIALVIIKNENMVVFKNIIQLIESLKALEAYVHKDEATYISTTTSILMSMKIFEQIQDDEVGVFF